MSNNSLANLIATLVANGFHIHKVDRFPHSNNIVYTYKYEKLGARVNYCILFSEDKEEKSITDSLVFAAKKFNSTPIIVSDNFKSLKCKTYSKTEFFGFFGGIVNTGLVLIPNLTDILDELGHNRIPVGLSGEAADLHELYVNESLQFVMESPTRRYGIDRSFEKLPDGVVLGKEKFMLLLDSKAYSKGFKFKADDLKRFASYVEDFRYRYSQFFGNILSFVVVSGHFNDSEKALGKRSEEFYKMCYCRLSCIESKTLGDITAIVKDNPEYRSSISWKNIFSKLKIEIKAVQEEILRISKDKLV